MTTTTHQNVAVMGPRHAGGQDVTLGRAATVAEAREIARDHARIRPWLQYHDLRLEVGGRRIEWCGPAR